MPHQTPGADDLLLACVPRLRRYARALTGNAASADDLVQDTLERGWARLASWQAGTDMRAWLFSIMHNVRIDQLRRNPAPVEEFDAETHASSTQDDAAVRLQLRDMESALRLLPEDQRAVLLLVGLEELRYEEVAAMLEIPLGTVMSRLARAREKLRALMEGRPLRAPLKVVK
jgi:RNA polymerase sigma-70 factor (ECF subfamily)